MADFLERFKEINADVLTSIKNSEPIFLAKAKKGYVCPCCGNGSGASGTGIVKDPNHVGKWTCFKCKGEGAGGSYDVLDLFGQANNISDYMDKVKGAAAYYGFNIESPSGTQEKSPRNDFKQEGVQTMAQVKTNAVAKAQNIVRGFSSLEVKDYTKFYNECNQNLDNPVAAAYLAKRGINVGTASVLGVGYCEEWQSPKALRDGKKPPSSARIIIPVNKNSYVARAVDDGQVAKEYRKMWEKGNGEIGLFAERNLYDAIDETPVFVTEGAFDAMSIMECGHLAIALNSTSNIDRLGKLLEKKPTDATLILCLDNDEAGIKALPTLKRELQRLNLSYIVADICNGYKDPNESFVMDREGFAKAVEKAVASIGDRPDNTLDYLNYYLNDEIEEFKKSANVKTGFAELDKKARGIFPGVYSIAGGTSLGKTTFINQLADQLAESGNDVIMFSLESSRLELVTKSLARLTFLEDRNQAMNSLDIRLGNKKPILDRAIATYSKKIGNRVSIIEGNFRCNFSFISDYIKRYVTRTGKTPIVIIDYLQILKPDKEGNEDTRIIIDNIVTELERMSKNMKMPILVVSSINRTNYLNPIDFESLKGSGGIEYTADVVWGLQFACLNEDIFTKSEVTAKRERIKEAKAASPRQIELVCLKSRFCAVGWSVFFNYYPANDVYVENPWFIPENAKGEGKKTTTTKKRY